MAGLGSLDEVAAAIRARRSARDSRAPLPASLHPLTLEHVSGAQQGRLTRFERWRGTGKFGDMTASRLQSIMDRADRGEVAEWCELCEHMIKTDPDVLDAYTTRLTRVVQADAELCAADETPEAEKARALIEWAIKRCENFEQAEKDMLHAVAAGFSALENAWAFDARANRYYVRTIDVRHGNRFIYDESYQLRINDHGQKHGEGQAARFGEALDPRRWVVHQHREQPGYPGAYGCFRSIAWPWMFKRWADKYAIMALERFGAPFIDATVPGNTPAAVRERIREDLENMTTDHVAVHEEGVQIEMLAAGAAAGNDEAYLKYMAAKRAEIMRGVLGTDDATGAGESGSRAAVETRVSATMDPRMVADGSALNATLRGQWFRQLLDANVHEVGPGAPAPFRKYATAADEAQPNAIEVREEGRLAFNPAAANPLQRSQTPSTTQRFASLRAALIG